MGRSSTLHTVEQRYAKTTEGLYAFDDQPAVRPRSRCGALASELTYNEAFETEPTYREEFVL